MNKFFKTDLSLSQKENQDAYIFYSYCKIFKQDSATPFQPWWNNFHKNNDILSSLSNSTKGLFLHLYYEGKEVYQVLNCTIEDFHNAIFFQKSVYPGHLEYRSKRRQPYWYNRHGTDFRKPQKYVRNHDHKPKEVTQAQSNKAAWREEKGFDKDYRKQNNSPYGNRKTFAKKVSNHCFRRREKELIRSEQYDKLFSTKDRTYFDPWDWD